MTLEDAVNPCIEDFGSRPMALLGSDFVAGCRENDRPEALNFMIAHQLGHVKAGHTRWCWEMIASMVKYVPVLRMVVAQNMEFAADLHAAKLHPGGATDALALLTVGKDNFPYIRAEEFVKNADAGWSIWMHAAKWISGHPSCARRLDRLSQLTNVDLRPRHPRRTEIATADSRDFI